MKCINLPLTVGRRYFPSNNVMCVCECFCFVLQFEVVVSVFFKPFTFSLNWKFSWQRKQSSFFSLSIEQKVKWSFIFSLYPLLSKDVFFHLVEHLFCTHATVCGWQFVVAFAEELSGLFFCLLSFHSISHIAVQCVSFARTSSFIHFIVYLFLCSKKCTIDPFCMDAEEKHSRRIKLELFSLSL